MCIRMNRGFTLIEMIIAIVVLGILGVFTFTFFGDYMNRDFCITPAPLIFVSSLLLFMFTLSHWGSSFIFYD